MLGKPKRQKGRLTYGVFCLVIIVAGVAAYSFLGSADVASDPVQRRTIEAVLIGITVLSLLTVITMSRRLKNSAADFEEMKTDFIAVASHELRSPLTSIRWRLSALRKDATLSPDAREIVNDLYERIRLLISLSGTFLVTASADHTLTRTSDLKIVNLAPVLTSVVGNAQSIAQMKKIKIESSPFDTSIIIKADAERLRLVFDNLLSNAIKYSPEGAVVTFEFVDRGNEKIFAVHDNGIGVPESEIREIFLGFHRAANAQRSGTPGSGFGLYMAKKIIDFHGGTITCDSKPGSGTTFTIVLPSHV